MVVIIILEVVVVVEGENIEGAAGGKGKPRIDSASRRRTEQRARETISL